MKLLTKELERKLPPLYSTEKVEIPEKKLICKFFTPDSNWTWYATEYNPKERLFFGLVDGFDKEWGYFSLTELEAVRGKLGLPVERDRYFSPKKFKELST